MQSLNYENRGYFCGSREVNIGFTLTFSCPISSYWLEFLTLTWIV